MEGVKGTSEEYLKRVIKGEFVFLVGHTGAGKTTFLKLIYREILPTTGKIFFENQDISLLTL